MVGFVSGGPANCPASYVTAFPKGLSESGYVEGQNVTVEYHWPQCDHGKRPLSMGYRWHGDYWALAYYPRGGVGRSISARVVEFNLSLK